MRDRGPSRDEAVVLSVREKGEAATDYRNPPLHLPRRMRRRTSASCSGTSPARSGRPCPSNRLSCESRHLRPVRLAIERDFWRDVVLAEAGRRCFLDRYLELENRESSRKRRFTHRRVMIVMDAKPRLIVNFMISSAQLYLSDRFTDRHPVEKLQEG